MKIGYQGIEGSNSEAVAKQFEKSLHKECVLIPLVNSKNVVDALENNVIDYGVMATYNILGGIVTETKEALKNKNFKLIETIRIPIHHCLFKKKNVDLANIRTIASHEQALKQTNEHIRHLFPNVNTVQIDDTALAAKYLSEDILDNTVAVICRKNAGELFNLDLVYENIEDNTSNYTEFGIYTNREV